MKSIGIVRKIDALGRIVLPMELRMTLNIKEGDALEIFTDADSIMLRKYQRGCAVCGSMDKTTEFDGITLCEKCISAFAKKARI